MKIKKRDFKILVKTLLSETPLSDIIRIPDMGKNSGFNLSSVGYNVPKNINQSLEDAIKEFDEKAKVLMSSSEDNWYIVLFEEYKDSNEIDEINKKLKKYNIPPNAKIIAITSSPLDKDYKTPEWTIIHDIIGHTLAKYIPIAMRQSYKSWSKNISKIMNYLDDISPNLHKSCVPVELRIASPGDLMPDIWASILLKKFDFDCAKKIFDNEKLNSAPVFLGYRKLFESENVIDFLKDGVDNFIAALDPGLNFLEIWYL
jgi:hypothetical protein